MKFSYSILCDIGFDFYSIIFLIIIKVNEIFNKWWNLISLYNDEKIDYNIQLGCF